MSAVSQLTWWTCQQCLNWRVGAVFVCKVFLARYEQLELKNFNAASCVRYLRRSFRRYYPQTALGSRIRCFRWSKNKTFCFVLFQIDQFGKSMHFKWCGLMAWFPPNQVPLEATIEGEKIWRYCCSHHIRIAPVHHRCRMSGLLYQKPPFHSEITHNAMCCQNHTSPKQDPCFASLDSAESNELQCVFTAEL